VYAADAKVADPLRAEAERRAEALIVDLEQTGSRFEDGVRRQLWQRLALDFQALERVKADITAAIRAGERYAIMFFPEIGHAPWFALHGEDTVMGRGRALMRLQDAWLHELFETVKRSGRLERTVIAVTADHGLRTRAEDPALTIGRLSDDMFRVPLLIYGRRCRAPCTGTTTSRSATRRRSSLAARSSVSSAGRLRKRRSCNRHW
jgi:Sulfatase